VFDRTRWSAVGAAVAVTLAGGVALPSARATKTDGGGAGVVFVPIVPCRLFDTRPAPDNVGPRTSALAATDVYTQQVTGTNGNCTIPAAATAVSLNVTTTNATAASYLTLWPADASRPLASNLNWVPSSPPTPNKVDVKLSADGRVSLYNNAGNVDVLADIVGYYADHNHDDRYYTKAEVDAAVAAGVGDGVEEVVLGIYDLHHTGLAPLLLNEVDGCANFGANEATGLIPITAPIGARLLSVTATILDKAGANTYELGLSSRTVTTAGDVERSIVDLSGGSAVAETTDVDLIPPAAEFFDPGETIYFTFFQELDYSSFCRLTVTYDTTP